eukprot:s97_g20.t1
MDEPPAALQVQLPLPVAPVAGAFSPACSVRFWSYGRFSWQAQELRRFWKGRILFCAAGTGHWALVIHVAGTYFLHVAKILAGVGRSHFAWQAQCLAMLDDVESLSLWGNAHFDTARAAISSLCAHRVALRGTIFDTVRATRWCQIALVVARC